MNIVKGYIYRGDGKLTVINATENDNKWYR